MEHSESKNKYPANKRSGKKPRREKAKGTVTFHATSKMKRKHECEGEDSEKGMIDLSDDEDMKSVVKKLSPVQEDASPLLSEKEQEEMMKQQSCLPICIAHEEVAVELKEPKPIEDAEIKQSTPRRVDLRCHEKFVAPVIQPPVFKFKSEELRYFFFHVFPACTLSRLDTAYIPYLIGRLDAESTIRLYTTYPRVCREVISHNFDKYFPAFQSIYEEILYVLRCYQRRVTPDVGKLRCEFQTKAAVFAMLNSDKPHKSFRKDFEFDIPDLEPAKVHQTVKEAYGDLFKLQSNPIERVKTIAIHIVGFMDRHTPEVNREITQGVISIMANPAPLPFLCQETLDLGDMFRLPA